MGLPKGQALTGRPQFPAPQDTFVPQSQATGISLGISCSGGVRGPEDFRNSAGLLGVAVGLGSWCGLELMASSCVAGDTSCVVVGGTLSKIQKTGNA